MPTELVCSHDWCGQVVPPYTPPWERMAGHRVCGGCRLIICYHHPDCEPATSPAEFLPAHPVGSPNRAWRIHLQWTASASAAGETTGIPPRLRGFSTRLSQSSSSRGKRRAPTQSLGLTPY